MEYTIGGATQAGIIAEERIPTGVISPKTVPMHKYNRNEKRIDKNVAMSVVLAMPNLRKKLRSIISLFILPTESPNIISLQYLYHRR
ncbi:MAG: hypothetical protein A2Y65_12270 [Deltaproteobacteria bacterium RBG_13_52_11]|nr:MAG: hypothetical protein A2Y65_12270 [Deltaproteobacteria bacterium RBG_13_52_11]